MTHTLLETVVVSLRVDMVRNVTAKRTLFQGGSAKKILGVVSLSRPIKIIKNMHFKPLFHFFSIFTLETIKVLLFGLKTC